MSIDLYEDVTEFGSNYVELLIKLSVLNIQSKNNHVCEIWSITCQLQPTKVSPSGAKS